MTPATTAEGRSRNLILAAMIFAVSMTFIDQTIISIAAPHIQRELGLSATGVQWAVNACLLALAALFAFGGRLAGTLGHRAMVTLGVALIAVSRPETAYRPAPMDYRGLALIVAGVSLSVFGFQQSSIWGWRNPAIAACIAAAWCS